MKALLLLLLSGMLAAGVFVTGKQAGNEELAPLYILFWQTRQVNGSNQVYTREDNKMNITEAPNWRYAVRKFTTERVEVHKLNELLTATRLSPSSYGLQPWRIVVVDDTGLWLDHGGYCLPAWQLYEIYSR
jgi:hypothetical protein